jgi:hypothetical protein
MRRDSTAVVRDKLLSGKLTVTKVTVGKGTGKMCIGCDRPIPPDGIEYQLDLPDPASGTPIQLWFDERCLASWREERKRVAAA